jgi:hypothetical protein
MHININYYERTYNVGDVLNCIKGTGEVNYTKIEKYDNNVISPSLPLFPSLYRSIDLLIRLPQGLKPKNVRTFSLAQIPKEPKAVNPYYKE